MQIARVIRLYASEPRQFRCRSFTEDFLYFAASIASFTRRLDFETDGLSPNTQYAYRIRSKDASGNLAITSNQTFTTAAAGSATTPVEPSLC